MTAAQSLTRTSVTIMRNILCVLLLALPNAFVGASLAAAENCISINRIEEPPAWTSSGTWAGDDRLLFLDALRGSIQEYSVAGDDRGRLVESHFEFAQNIPVEDKRFTKRSTSFPFEPSRIERVGDRIVVKNETGHLLWFSRVEDNQFGGWSFTKVTESEQDIEEALAQANNLSEPKASAIFDLAVFKTDTLLIYGDVVMPDKSWARGFFLISQRETLGGQLVPIEGRIGPPTEDPYRGYYTSTNRYLTSMTDQSAAALVLADEPQILIFDEGSVDSGLPAETYQLGSIISDFQVPEATKWTETSNLAERFRIRSGMGMIMGLYSSGGDLYVVKRQPGGVAGRASISQLWTITKIRRDGMTAEQELVLPIESADAVIVPGDKHWAFLQKTSVAHSGVLRIGSLTLIPSAWIENPGHSPLASGTFACAQYPQEK